ncbi:hypothetical protein L0B53_16245 [Vibrio sp. SS-MA-C1-2]|uniref:hypothetical protein n=1 Tax=Vibrio sp. SS-MA-C1-2 TaxID=2908646 RepID=UPI001F1CF159|nr:hypothetical protein [Vibrio sp. SS-MA-C1-2]UJF18550.1 hypothetical protein L0B53_16245 [Vibrio sp. SS-MA-C1-2]
MIKYDICFCIVLYNKEIASSNSISSISNLLNQGCEKNIKVVVFNNGPHKISNDSVEWLEVNHVLINGSLSKIYNKFLEQYLSEKYVILDDDTTINKEFMDSVLLDEFNIMFPNIYCKGSKHYPVKDGKVVQTISSGLSLSYNGIKLIKKIRTTVFDESFELYGIDSEFCNFIYKNKLPYLLSEANLQHDLSHINGDGTFRRGRY